MSTAPRLLAIETSGRVGRIAAGAWGGDVVERRIDSPGRRHAQTLVAEINGLLADLGLGFRDLDALAVSTGPGSFTGLRVGVVAAKTIGYAANVPVVPVETFDAIAHGVADSGITGRILVFDDAQRGDLFVREYEIDELSFRDVGPLSIVPSGEWIESRRPTDMVTGPGCERFGAELEGRCRVLEESLWRPSAAVVLDVGGRNLAAGRTADVATLEPAYKRRSSAEVKWDERHGNETPGES